MFEEKSITKSTVYRRFSGSIGALGLSALVAGCAGPSTPFGPVGLWQALTSTGPKIKSKNLERIPASENSDSVQISFEPRSQFYIRPKDLKITIRDDRGIPEDAKIKISYNDFEVTENIEVGAHSKGQYLLNLSFENLRLLPGNLNEVEVSYSRGEEDPQVFTAQLQRPQCQFGSRLPIQSLKGFNVPPTLIRTVEDSAFDQSLNPALLAGLIAQESGFNPKAVSPIKALGLTQITSQAQLDILERTKTWPKFPGIEDLSFLELKMGILTNEIHHKNEWRLDPALSIVGGSLYLQKIQEYWLKPRKINLAAHSGSDITDVILASYNIGPASVSRSIDRSGVDWLRDPEGRQAIRYINMVGSYCETFASGDPL